MQTKVGGRGLAGPGVAGSVWNEAAPGGGKGAGKFMAPGSVGALLKRRRQPRQFNKRAPARNTVGQVVLTTANGLR